MRRKWRITLAIAIGVVVYLALLLTLLLCERSASGATIRSLFDAFWYSIVTISTVGYGDYTPVSVAGRIVGILFLLGSVVFFSVVIGQIASMLMRLSMKRRYGYMGTNFRNHVIILGWDAFAEDMTRELLRTGHRVSVMTSSRDDIDLLHQKFDSTEVFACHSDINTLTAPGIMELVNAIEADSLVLNNGSDTKKLIAAVNIRKALPELQLVVMVEDSSLSETFRNAGVSYVLVKNALATKMLASYVFEPQVATYERDLISSSVSDRDCDLQQYKITAENPYLGRTYGELFAGLKASCNTVAVGLYKTGRRELVKLPKDDQLLELGDYVLVITNHGSTRALQKLFGVPEGRI